jgi:WD repeat-containing protein 68
MPSDQTSSRKEIYTYDAPWDIFGLAWSHRTDSVNCKFRLAIGSFIEEYTNKVRIVKKSSTGAFSQSCEFDHP